MAHLFHLYRSLTRKRVPHSLDFAGDRLFAESAVLVFALWINRGQTERFLTVLLAISSVISVNDMFRALFGKKEPETSMSVPGFR